MDKILNLTWKIPPSPAQAWIPQFTNMLPAAGSGLSDRLDSLETTAVSVARKNNIPPNIFLAILDHESGFNPEAVGDNGDSIGLGQVYLPAHPDFDANRALHGNNGTPDVDYQLAYSARFLRNLHDQCGDWSLAVKRYNGSGPSSVAYMDSVIGLAGSKYEQYGGV